MHFICLNRIWHSLHILPSIQGTSVSGLISFIIRILISSLWEFLLLHLLTSTGYSRLWNCGLYNECFHLHFSKHKRCQASFMCLFATRLSLWFLFSQVFFKNTLVEFSLKILPSVSLKSKWFFIRKIGNLPRILSSQRVHDQKHITILFVLKHMSTSQR